MFKVYNHSLQKTEYVKEIDLNKHWKAYLVPFDSIPEENISATDATILTDDGIKELENVDAETACNNLKEMLSQETEEVTPPKRGRPKAN